jgi:hypothetical protein
MCLGRDSVVGIATHYGLDGPGIEFQWKGGDFPYPSGTYIGPRHLFIQRAPTLSPGVKRQWSGVKHPPSSSAEVEERVQIHL